MSESPKKLTFFLSTYSLSFLIFCFLVTKLGIHLEGENMPLQYSHFIWPAIFLFLQIAGIVFSAILPSSLLIALLPMVLSIFAGIVIVNSWVVPFLTLGFPLAYLFYSVHHNIKNRIKILFSVDIRRPITTFFLLFLFFGSMGVVPFYEKEIMGYFKNTMEKYIPEEVQAPAGQKISLDMSIHDLIEEQVNTQISICKGDPGCEEMIRKEVEKESAKYLTQFPMLSDVDITSEKPFIEEVTGSVLQDVIPISSISEKQDMGGILQYVWAFIIFVLIAPFCIVLSFITMIGIRILYYSLRLTGVLHITKKSVQQETIV